MHRLQWSVETIHFICNFVDICSGFAGKWHELLSAHMLCDPITLFKYIKYVYNIKETGWDNVTSHCSPKKKKENIYTKICKNKV